MKSFASFRPWLLFVIGFTVVRACSHALCGHFRWNANMKRRAAVLAMRIRGTKVACPLFFFVLLLVFLCARLFGCSGHVSSSSCLHLTAWVCVWVCFRAERAPTHPSTHCAHFGVTESYLHVLRCTQPYLPCPTRCGVLRLLHAVYFSFSFRHCFFFSVHRVRHFFLHILPERCSLV